MRNLALLTIICVLMAGCGRPPQSVAPVHATEGPGATIDTPPAPPQGF
jgi:hypothetical protein